MAEVLVTGASTGIGMFTALGFADAGDHVIAGVRDPSTAVELQAHRRTSDSIDLRPLDVTDPMSIDRFINEAARTGDGIDVLVNNAGVAFAASVEDSDEKRTRAVIDTNFYGPLRLLRAALPHLRARRRGHIVNVSSLNAHTGRPFVGVYAASKAALDALSVSLAGEVAKFGIHVTIVEPGSFRTAIDRKFLDTIRPSAGYAGAAEALVERRNRAASEHPRHVADAIVHAAHTCPPPLRIQVPD